MSTQQSFTDTVRRMWDARPPRIPSEQGGNAKVAGVCEGIGVRYQIDPTIVRILFVVSLFTLGGGLAAYLLAWMCMPRYGMATAPIQSVIRSKDQLSPPERKERSTGWLLIFFFLLTFGSFSADGTFASTGLLSVALLLAAWWLLHQRTPVPPAGLLADAPADTLSTPVDLSAYYPAEGTAVPPGRVTPPAWDPLGAAPFAWDLPEPGPAPAPPPRRKPLVWPWIALSVAGMMSVAAVAFTGFGVVVNHDDVGREQHHQPVAEAQLQSTYKGELGPFTVDFRELPPLEESRTVDIHGGIGPVTINLPTAVPVELTCEQGLGEMDCRNGTYNDRASGGTLTLNIQGGIGPVTVAVPAAARGN